MSRRLTERFRRPTPSFVISLVALFFALGGTAGALTTAAVPLAKRALLADNAKKLEGKTSAQLLATAAKAAQQAAAAAAQAPGPASSGAGLITVKSVPWSIAPNQGADFTAQCDAGQKAISGGWEDPSGWGHSWDSRPTPDGAGWKIYVTVGSNAPGAQSGTVYAVCLK